VPYSLPVVTIDIYPADVNPPYLNSGSNYTYAPELLPAGQFILFGIPSVIVVITVVVVVLYLRKKGTIDCTLPNWDEFRKKLKWTPTHRLG